MQQIDHDKFLTTKEASNLLGITTHALRRMRGAGGPQAHCYARLWMYRVSDLISWGVSNTWVLDLAEPWVRQEVEKLAGKLRDQWKMIEASKKRPQAVPVRSFTAA